ncbi:MAG: dienelactone hydrolase family protein [Planctomycetota bacterium]|nr:dienelactone hydrolase family protein [Planctomycetota bacterium]
MRPRNRVPLALTETDTIFSLSLRFGNAVKPYVEKLVKSLRRFGDAAESLDDFRSTKAWSLHRKRFYSVPLKRRGEQSQKDMFEDKANAVQPMLDCRAVLRILPWLCLGCLCLCSSVANSQVIPGKRGAVAKTLDGTSKLELQGDIASTLVDGVDRFLIKELAGSVQKRIDQWPKPNRSDANASNPPLYEAATKELRDELRTRLGMIDVRVPCDAFIVQSTGSTAKDAIAEVASNDTCRVFSVRWPVFEGVDATGLLVIPSGEVQFHAVVVPDAGQAPEQLCGQGDNASDIALALAAQGGVVVIPNVVQRTREARNGRSKLTDQEFLYRSAFVLGRHVIGNQVAEISAAVDALQKTYGDHPNLVAGWGEGGCLALYAAAVDTRFQVACVSGHFGPREQIWSEPIHRNVHGLLNRFGDAQLAALVAPRTLIIDTMLGPEVTIAGDGGAPGTLSGPSAGQAESEWRHAVKLLDPWLLSKKVQLVKPDSNEKKAGTSSQAIQVALGALGVKPRADSRDKQPLSNWKAEYIASGSARRLETLSKWNRFQEVILEGSATERDRYWSKLDTNTPDSFASSIKPFFEAFRGETVGDWEWEAAPLNPRTRLIYDEPKWLGYEVVLDVHEDVIAYGTLLIPRDEKPIENRPCVVFQHGLEGRPSDTIVGDHPAYHDVSKQLVEQGYVVFAPQNLYLFQDRFRTLQRKSNPLGKTLFSTIVAQHKQIVRWLGQRQEIDPKRIAFYGLSYGGKSAMRIPALVPEYCLSICSADFNDWVWKNASTNSPYSYVWTNEYEIFEFGLGNHFNYAEMAAFIAPRPFMVERGHFDGVAPDERVGLEFAKVNRLYSARLGLTDRCRIEWFSGPHTINGKGTFDFLREHLK